MSTEIPIWVNGKIRWLSGIDKKTTCKDIVEVLLDGEGLNKLEAKDFTIMERWRKVERQLNENSKILKIWTHWGNEKKEVRLCLRRIDNEVDSGRGSPDGSGYMPSLRRKRNRIRGNGKPPWAYRETLHPRRLAELGRFGDYSQIKNRQNEAVNDCEPLNDTNFKDKICDAKDIDIKTRDTEIVNSRKSSGHRSYHCSGTGRLHSTPCSENHSKRTKCCSKREFKQKVRNSENIERLMKLILAQGATIQSQLQKLKEREEQIELLEQERHRERIEKNGRNYLLETYLGSLKDAEIPDGLNNSEGENETEKQKTETENLNSSEVVVCLNKGNKSSLCEKDQLGRKDNSGLQFKPRRKNTRSRSESRTQESKLEGNLKRAFSDNAIAETNCATVDCSTREVSPQFVMQNTKEEYEDVVELKRIQSQIEMWEKVFKINKKLEKEEENLVRLHIKIKKIQSENYIIAKDKTETVEKENKKATMSEELLAEVNDSEKIRYKQDCAELEKNLECVKSDLENNSKEIYKNFTRLIEEDEKVAHKHNHLLKIMADLERTNQEHDMLSEMITMKENQQFETNQISSFGKSTSDFRGKNTIENLDEGLPIENKVKMKEAGTENSAVQNLCSKSLDLPRTQEYVNQRTENNVADQEVLLPTKPKIVKISFENKLKNYETSGNSKEKMLYKDPMPVPVGALKSILKNRRNGLNKINNLNNEFQNQQELSNNYEPNGREGVLVPKNLGVNDSYIQNYHPQITDVPNRINSNYPRTTQYPLYVNFTNENCQVFNGKLSELSENFKGVNILKNNPHPQEISRSPFQNSTIVTTKALIHNDTDSSTSSDTSGLSSMYSSSTTVEETYAEKSYVLDTLV